MDIFSGVQGGISLVIGLVLLVVKGFALVDAVGRPESSFTLHDTLPKRTWLTILGLGFIAHLLFFAPLQLMNLIGTVAALVYLAQLRGSSI